MANLHIKKGDTVIVLSGDDKGVQGEVIATSPEEGKVLVKGANIIHKHVKPRRQGEAGGGRYLRQQGRPVLPRLQEGRAYPHRDRGRQEGPRLLRQARRRSLRSQI